VMNLNIAFGNFARPRVGHCECGISNDVARGAVKDRLLGYVSLSNHPYRLHVADGVDKSSN
jgi:hypothetical protein